jgi:exopolysaccharide production protein ExoY
MMLRSTDFRPDAQVAPLAVPVLSPATVRSAPVAGIYAGAGKRALDLVALLLALPVVLPVVALLALFVALDGGRPFYFQDRLGRGGRVFRIVKLRTMVADAEARLAAHLAADPAAAAEWAATQKLRQDPRITRFGRILRKASLDELPQLWNVLTGDMSLVGPRPMMVCQRDLYPGRAYFALRPGLTGPWQVSDRNSCSFADRARFDEAYARELSLAGDLGLLARTVSVVLRGTGC